MPEHHGADDGYAPSPLVTLAAIAARTKTIKLGSAIALAPLYHPVRFAEDCAVLDILSGGRTEMAVAVGYRRREAEAYGIDFSSRGRRTDEFLEIVRRLWAGETFSYAGKYFTLKNACDRSHADAAHTALSRRIHRQGTRAHREVRRRLFRQRGGVGSIRDKLRACGKDPAGARMRIQGLFVLVARDPQKAMEEVAAAFSLCEQRLWAMAQRGPRFHGIR